MGDRAKYGERVTLIEALPLQRSAQILSGNLVVVRYRTARVSARFLKGRVRVGAARTPRDKPTEERLLICTDPDLPATEIITGYAKRWRRCSQPGSTSGG